MVDTDTGNLFIVGSFNKRTDPDFKVSAYFFTCVCLHLQQSSNVKCRQPEYTNSVITLAIRYFFLTIRFFFLSTIAKYYTTHWAFCSITLEQYYRLSFMCLFFFFVKNGSVVFPILSEHKRIGLTKFGPRRVLWKCECPQG